MKHISQCDLKLSQTSHTTYINNDQFGKRQMHLEFWGITGHTKQAIHIKHDAQLREFHSVIIPITTQQYITMI